MDQERFAEELAQVREIRARHPELLRNRHASRRRRSLLGSDGRLLLLEVEDLARGALSAGAGPRALADRADVLARVCQALELEGVDGVIAPSDVIDDLVMMDVLGARLAVGAANPGIEGGDLAFTAALTAFDPAQVAAVHLDAGALAAPVDRDDPAGAEYLATLARAVDTLAGTGSVVLLEPSWWRGRGADRRRDDSTEALIRAVQVVSALGSRSTFTWLVLPAVDGLAEVIGATTLPVLVRASDTLPLAHPGRWEELMAMPGVRGAVLPVGALFPLSGDPVGAVRALAALVHPDLAPDGVRDGAGGAR